MIVWVVIAQGVYDQGVYAVFSQREYAEAFVQKYSPDDDGYHYWRVEPHALNDPPTSKVHPAHPKTKITIQEVL